MSSGQRLDELPLLVVVALLIGCHSGTYSLGVGPSDGGSAGRAASTAGSSSMDSGTAGANAGPGGAGSGGASGGGGVNGRGGVGANGGGGGAMGGAAGTGPTVFGTLTRASAASDGTLGNGASNHPVSSSDGRFVLFASSASNFVSDVNGKLDVYLHDRTTGATTRVSVTSAGGDADGDSDWPAVSADATRVAFVSSASNLIPGATGSVKLVVLSGAQSDLTSFRPGFTNVTPLDADGDSATPVFASDGSLVYRSSASNLVTGDGNGRDDFFVYQPSSNTTQRIVIANDRPDVVIDPARPSLSSDGSLLAFSASVGGAPRNVYVTNTATGATETVGVTPGGPPSSGDCGSPSLSADGRFVAFVCTGSDLVGGDSNGVPDVFLRDRQTAVTRRLSVTASGAEADGASSSPALSADARRLVFQSNASNIGPGPVLGASGGLVHCNLQTGDIERFFAGTSATGLDAPATELALNADGSVLVFTTAASNLLFDTNGVADVFTFEFTGIR